MKDRRFGVKVTIITPDGNPIDWGSEELGTYTLTIPVENITDGNGVPISQPLTATFENLADVLDQ